MTASSRLARRAMCASVLLAALLAISTSARAQLCAVGTRVTWPATNPVWSLCFVQPSQSSGIDGSGLEIRDVRYKGRMVLFQAHAPILNVVYDQSPCQYFNFCGFPGRSYRDANNIVQGFDNTTRPPTTVCDHPGFDSGNFFGVVVDNGPTALTLTTQTMVGWYRYTETWTFRPDGTIEPRIGFTAVTAPCTSCNHDHHGYFRFDFDIDGNLDDVVEALMPSAPAPVWRLLGESSVPRLGALKWRIRDLKTARAYQIIAGPNDGVADQWAVADIWALRFHGNELDDGGGGFFRGDFAHLNDFVNGEALNGQDVVVWYRVGARHTGFPVCDMAGPNLVPEPGWDSPGCPGSMASCTGVCTDLTSDQNNCGACGHACTQGFVCTTGQCTNTCPTGRTPCQGICVNLQSDALNCGSCGRACGASRLCSSGRCIPCEPCVCPDGFRAGACANTASCAHVCRGHGG